jgi:hypothetical protein
LGGIGLYQILPTHSASAPFQYPEARQTFVLRMSLGISKPSSHPNVHIDLKKNSEVQEKLILPRGTIVVHSFSDKIQYSIDDIH